MPRGIRDGLDPGLAIAVSRCRNTVLAKLGKTDGDGRSNGGALLIDTRMARQRSQLVEPGNRQILTSLDRRTGFKQALSLIPISEPTRPY